MTSDQLVAAIDAGDAEQCIRLFEHATEEQRRSVANDAMARFRVHSRQVFIEQAPNSFLHNPALSAAQAAVLASCSVAQLRELGPRSMLHGPMAHQILRARPPSWIESWANWALDHDPNHWSLARSLMSDGRCGRPKSRNYITGMIYGVFDRNHLAEGPKPQNLREALLADPELLQWEIWQLFEVEGGGEHSLAAHDKYKSQKSRLLRWDDTLAELAREGVVPRERLLDASLGALERDFAPFRAGWFSRFHELLEPTIEERVARAQRYLGLLASKVPATVVLALDAIEAIDRTRPFDGDALIAGLSPPLRARAKGAVTAALKLLERAAEREPRHRLDAARTAATALGHESVDAQKDTLDFLDRFGDASDRDLAELVDRFASGVAPSLRPRLDRWKQATDRSPRLQEKQTEDHVAELERTARTLDPQLAERAGVETSLTALHDHLADVPAVQFDGTDIPRLDPTKRIRPIAELEELIDACAGAIENRGAIDELERCMEGISRLCGERPEDFGTRVGPLRKRARTLLDRGPAAFAGRGPGPELCGVILAWTAADVGVAEAQARCSVHHFLSRRALALAQRAAEGISRPLLSAPTHPGGWIDPLVLVERVHDWIAFSNQPDVCDKLLALLRMAFDGRPAALERAKNLPGESGAALRHALGGIGEQVGPDAALWVAAARARAPWDSDAKVEARHPDLGPDAGIAATYQDTIKRVRKFGLVRISRQPPVPTSIGLDLVTVLTHARPSLDRGGELMTPESVRWQATLWPSALESFFAEGACRIAANLDWWEAEWANRGFLEPLLDPDVPMRPMALLLLGLGLAAKQPGEHGLATDVLIAAIEDGRIDGETFGRLLAGLLPSGYVKAARLKRTLSDVARISPLHACVVRRALERGLRGNSKDVPRDIHALVELFAELSIDTGEPVSDAATRDFLSQFKGAGKAVRSARTLLSIATDAPRNQRRDAAAAALEHRLARARRWQVWRAALSGQDS